MLVATTGFGIAALKRMPLAETTAVVFVTPLIVTVLAVPLLRERVTRGRYAAVAAGFIGVLLIARPGGGLGGTGVALGSGGGPVLQRLSDSHPQDRRHGKRR
ncbi:MAG: DMT family transporter [Comamonadaceae bacterium]|nr:DMT family transporter [Comamonadaceae bacterium]